MLLSLCSWHIIVTCLRHYAYKDETSDRKVLNLYYSYLFRYEKSKHLCISVSAAMTKQNVVNPTFKEEERAPH